MKNKELPDGQKALIAFKMIKELRDFSINDIKDIFNIAETELCKIYTFDEENYLNRIGHWQKTNPAIFSIFSILELGEQSPFSHPKKKSGKLGDNQ